MISSDEASDEEPASLPVSSPVRSEQTDASSPVRQDWSSPLRQEACSSPIMPGSSPVRTFASSPELSPSSTESSPEIPMKRKKYQFYDEVQDSPKFWPTPAATTSSYGDKINVQLMCDTPAATTSSHGDKINVQLMCDSQNTGMDSNEDMLNGNDHIQSNHDISLSSSETSNSSEEGGESGESEASSSEEDEAVASQEDSEVESSIEEGSVHSNNSYQQSDESDSDEFYSPEVFTGCPLTVDQGVLILMNLFLKHKMEKLAVGDILKGLIQFFPKVHHMPRSQHLIFKYVKDLTPLPPEKIHFYCANCLYYFGTDPKKCESCDGEVSHKFFQLKIAAQLKNFFENHGLAEKISNYNDFRRMACQDETTLYDLCDGSVFKDAKVDSPFSLSLLGHTDGISIHDSAHLTLWPLEFVIAELPPALRYKFVIVSGVWLDECKPYLNTYLKPFVEELQSIAAGVTWTHPQTKVIHKSAVTVPGFCADAPARAQLQNILSHGGKYCCNICEQKMKKLPAEPVQPGVKKKSRRRVFTFEEYQSKFRTSERMKAQGKESRRKQQESRSKKLVAVKGVRGMSVVSSLPGCDRSVAVYPEYMHLLLCLLKEFFKLWFEVDGPWSLKLKQDVIDAFLLNIRVPHFITRIPRPTYFYHKWKANELRSFLLYYSAIILKECMKDEYYQHWLLLVESLYLLLQEKVTNIDICKAEVMLKMFCRDFKKLYKADNYTYYVHNLLHLSLVTKRYGPLWASSAFHFESFNGTLAKFIHGTKNQAQELVNNVQLASGIAILSARNNDKQVLSERPIELCDVMKHCQLSDEDIFLLSEHFQVPYKLFYRAKLSQGYIFTSYLYSREKKRSNFTISFFNSDTNQNEYGDIKCFVGARPDLKVALVKRFAVDHLRVISHTATSMVLNHLVPLKETNSFCLVEVSKIIGKVIKVRDFVCIRPNHFEVNL